MTCPTCQSFAVQRYMPTRIMESGTGYIDDDERYYCQRCQQHGYASDLFRTDEERELDAEWEARSAAMRAEWLRRHGRAPA